MAADQEDIDSLNRILTRLALTEDDKLEQILSKLLPAVIGKLTPGASPGLQKKVLEILSHANKRSRALPALRLPLHELATLYAAPGTGAMARNFAVVYLEQAVSRAPLPDRFAALPVLLTGLSTRPAQHQAMLLRMAAQCLEHLAAPGTAPSAYGSEQQFAAAYPFLHRQQQQQQVLVEVGVEVEGAEDGAAAADPGGSIAAGAGTEGAPGTPEAAAGDSRSPTADADRQLLLRFALSLMLYQPSSSKGPSNPLAAAQSAAAAAAAGAGGGGSRGGGGGGPQPMDVDAASSAAAAAALPAVPAGMSRADVAAVEGKAPPAGEVLLRQKLGFLNFSAAAGMDPAELLPAYLAASCDPNEQVSRRGTELLKKRCGIDAHRPSVDLEDSGLVERMFELFHGTAEDDSLAPEERRAPAGVALRARLLALFCKSVAAANCFPHSWTTVTVCLFGTQTTPRLRQAGMEFAVWVFKHAEPRQLAPAAATILDGCLSLLDDGSTRGVDVTSLTLRGFTYQAIGQLAQRQPQAFAGRTDIAAKFFAALATEPAGVRAAVQEATASLASAFRGAEGETAAALQQLLLESVQQQQPEAVRMAALQWAIKLFPFPHIPARYLCMLAAADPRFQIAEAAAEGLQPGKFASASGTGSAKANTASGSDSGSKGEGDGEAASAGAGSADVTTTSAATSSGKAGTAPAYPDFQAVLQYLQQQVPQLGRRPAEGGSLPLPPKAFQAAIAFFEACRRRQQKQGASSTSPNGGTSGSTSTISGGMDPASASAYLLLLENSLLPAAPSELHAAALSAMLAVAAAQPSAYAAAFAEDAARQQLLLRLLGHVDAAARLAAAQLLGMLAPHMGAGGVGGRGGGSGGSSSGAAAVGVTVGGAAASPAQRVAALCESLLGTLRAGSAEGAKHVKQEQLEGAAAAAGYVAAHLIQGTPPAPPELLLSLLQQLRHLLQGPAPAAPKASGTIDTTDTTADTGAAAGSSNTAAGTAESAAALVPAAAATGVTSGSSSLRAAAALALGHASLPLAPTTAIPTTQGPAEPAGSSQQQQPQRQLLLQALPDAAGIAAAAAGLLEDKDPKVVKKAATGLAYLCWGHAGQASQLTSSPAAAASPSPASGEVTETPTAAAEASAAAGASAAAAAGGLLQPSVSALLALRSSKSEDVLFAVGEALCFCFGGLPLTANDILHTPFTSLATWKQEQEQGQDQGQGQSQQQEPAAAPMEVEVEGSNGGTAATAAAGDGTDSAGGSGGGADVSASPAQAAAQRQILSAVVEECLLNPRQEVRCAGAVWLVSLLLYCGRHPRLVPLLPDVQQALSQLLGDPNELTQEMASRGLAAVYDMADEATRGALLDSLVATLSGAPQKRRAVKLSEDSKLFEAGQLGSVPGGGGLSTYKELCSLATELGQPDLVYRFMELANHQTAVNSSRGAAFGIASIARLASEQLGPHIARIIPRLYRYLYDPNGKVRDAMSHIWHALLDDPKASVTQNFDAIMRALLSDMGGGQWRVREAASLAMGDLLQGRRWDELQPHFGELWTMTLRVMDDIKESVRQAGIALARSVRGLTLRLADKELTPPSQGRQAVGVALPLLLEKGLTSQVPEVRGLALDTTCKLAAAAGPQLLRPHMVLLVPAMLESLSGLEDSRLNYIEQHAERLGLDARRLEGARVAAAQGGPAGETLDLCARYADVATMAELAPKLAGLVRRGVGLNTRAGAGRFITQVTRRLGSDMQPLASQLIRALTEACRADRSAAVRRAYAAAAALLCRYAPAARVNRFVSDALASLAADGADRDDRYVAGLLLRELGRESADVLTQHASQVAPPAYMAQFDDDADVAAIWQEVWEESTASAGAGLRLHMAEVVQLVVAGLQSGQWGRKKAASTAIRRIAESAGDALAPHAPALMDALLKEMPGRIWDGKDAVLAAVGSLSSSCTAVLAPEKRRQVVAALLDAAGKKKAAYRKEAMVQLEVVLLAFGGSSTSSTGSSTDGSAAANGSGSAPGAGQAAEGSAGDYYGLVSPLMLELAGSYVEAAQGGPTAMDTDQTQQQGQQGQEEGEQHPGKAVPAAQVAACLGAAFAAAPAATVWQQADAAAACLAALLGAAGKAGEQLAAVEAGCRLADRAAAVSGSAAGQQAQQQVQQVQQQQQEGQAAGLGPVLSPQQPGVAALLQCALQLAEEGKASQLREQCYRLSDLLLSLLWPALPAEEREAVLSRLGAAEGREKMPAIQAVCAKLAAKLRTLA